MTKIRNVLVIDDSKLARLTLSRLLKAKDLGVTEATSVKEGIEILQNESIDAAFIDVQMPEQDGFEGLSIIRQDPALKHLPCSMYSGDLSMEAQQEALDNGAQAYLFKPANTDSVENVLLALHDHLTANLTREEATPIATEAATKLAAENIPEIISEPVAENTPDIISEPVVEESPSKTVVPDAFIETNEAPSKEPTPQTGIDWRAYLASAVTRLRHTNKTVLAAGLLAIFVIMALLS